MSEKLLTIQLLFEVIMGEFTLSELEMMVYLQMDVDLQEITSDGATGEYKVFEFIRWCDRRNKIDELIDAIDQHSG